MHCLSEKIKNIIAAGCSFTQDGISGIPPTVDHDGGNSFIDYPDDGIVGAIPKSWAGMVAERFSVTSMVNVAAGSHGNSLLANSVFTLLKNFKYSPQDTLILFNISEPTRLDIPCDFENPDASKHIPWQKEIINHSYLSTSSGALQDIKSCMGVDAVSYLTSNFLWLLLEFLNEKKYQFAFMTMSDYTNDTNLGNLIDRFSQSFVKLDKWNSMIDFCVNNNLTISKEDLHPNTQGHQQIADRMIDFLHRSSIG